ncbi:MAG TPA: type IV secretion system DNA-binding domain-containing protein, partial [Opitutales bacterium]|nr:type IV secretion system DNA-binding domain-containing protein [Opitutales bacterium]
MIERNVIRILEPILDRRWIKKGLPAPIDTNLRIGNASAAFGRKGSKPVSLTVEQRLRHQIKAGATGSGKSVSENNDRIHDFIVGQPFLELDCHDSIEKLLRTLARNITAGKIPESVIDDIWLVSPANDKWCVRINPLECPSPEKAPVKIAPLMELLRVFWGDVMGPQTHEFTQNLLILLAERKIPLPQVSSLLSDTVSLRTHSLSLLNHRAREYFLGRYLSWSPRRRTQVAEAFLNKVTIFLADPRIAAMLDSPVSDIDFRRAMDQHKTILIEISKGQFFDSVGLLASMILVSLQQATFSRSDLPEAARTPYFIIIEEFPAFASSVTVEPFLNESRKFGVGLTLIAQTFASLDRGLLSSIRANCQTQMFFRLSPEDARIAAAGLTGEVRDLISRDLVSLPTGTAMLMQGGGPPQRLRVDYTPVPDRLNDRERQIIERIRKNIGSPLDLSHGAPTPTPA